MIRKLRLKFVAICMVLITAVLAVVLLSVYFAMQRNIQDLSRWCPSPSSPPSGEMWRI